MASKTNIEENKEKFENTKRAIRSRKSMKSILLVKEKQTNKQ